MTNGGRRLTSRLHTILGLNKTSYLGIAAKTLS